MSTEQMRWLLKVIQPERTLASLPGGAGLSQETHAVLLGLPPEIYAAELARMRAEAKEAVGELLADLPPWRRWWTGSPCRRALLSLRSATA